MNALTISLKGLDDKKLKHTFCAFSAAALAVSIAYCAVPAAASAVACAAPDAALAAEPACGDGSHADALMRDNPRPQRRGQMHGKGVSGCCDIGNPPCTLPTRLDEMLARCLGAA